MIYVIKQNNVEINSLLVTAKRFEIIHCDLWGKYHTPSSCGAIYFLILVDDYSRAVWVYLLFDKPRFIRCLVHFYP